MSADVPEKEKLADRYWRDSVWVYALLAAILILSLIAYARTVEPEWKRYQSEFQALLGQRFGKAAAAKFAFEIKQVFIEGGPPERCTTCHLGVDIPKLDGEDVSLVFRKHPQPELVAKHPFKKFGCILCHGGKGYALTREEAHFTEQKGWIDTFLSRDLARRYGFPESAGMVLTELKCNACHLDEAEVRGLPYINKAKKLFQDKKCTCCHYFEGAGGLVGPELTLEGDKAADLYDFSNIRDWKGLPPSVFSWHLLHFKAPYFVTPTSLMPNVNLTDDEIRSLALLVMSYGKVPEHLKVKVKSPPASVVASCRGE
jgi:hypothetical protein